MAFYKQILTESEKTNINALILGHQSTNDTECTTWGGSLDRYGYPLIKFTYRHRRYTLRVPRLVYFVSVQHTLSPNMHISHLCHNKTCIKF